MLVDGGVRLKHHALRTRLMLRSVRPELRRRAIWRNGKAFAQSHPASVKQYVDDGARSATFIISTQDEDRAQDVVVSRGCRVENFKLNPTVLLNHDGNSYPIGVAEKDGALAVTIEDKRVLSTCFFHDLTQEARDTYELVRAGVLRMTSIGFMPEDVEDRPERGVQVNLWDLLEWSICVTPCNPHCSVIARQLVDAGKLGERLKRAIEPIAARKAIWSPGWGLGVAKRRKDVDDGDGVDIHAVALMKTKFPDQEAASTWCEEQDYRVDEPEEKDDAWVFIQRPLEDFDESTLETNEVEDGVMIISGQLAEPGDPKATDDAKDENWIHVTVERYDPKANATSIGTFAVAEGRCTYVHGRLNSVPSDVASAIVANPRRGSKESGGYSFEWYTAKSMHLTYRGKAVRKQELPYGAQAMLALIDHCKTYKTRVEQEKVKAFHDEIHEDAVDLLKEVYPDIKMGGEHEEPDGDEDEEKRVRTGLQAKRIGRKVRERLTASADFMDELSEEPNLTRQQRGACKYHGGEIRGISSVKEDDEPEDDIEGETDKRLRQLAKNVQAGGERLADMLFRYTGRRV